MRLAISSLMIAYMLTGCGGDDATGPAPERQTRISVTIDWPAVRHEGFVDARFEVWKIMDAQHDNVVVAAGTLPSSGVTTIAYTATCREGWVTGHYITLRGHYTAYEELGYEDCMEGVPAICTAEPQQYSVPQRDPDSGGLACRPPS